MRIAVRILFAIAIPSAVLAQNVQVLIFEGETKGVVVASAEGGNAVGEVVEEPRSISPFPLKHLGNIRYEPLRLGLSPNQCTSAYSLINTALGADYQRKNGELLTVDPRGNVLRRVRFYHALVSEAVFPATGETGDSAAVGLGLAIEYSRSDQPAGLRIAVPPVPPPLKEVQAILSLTALPPTGVALETIVIVNGGGNDPVGESRDYELEPLALEIPEIRFLLHPSDALPFYAWFEDFVINGNSGSEQEKAGSLVYSASNGAELFTISLQGVGISSMKPVLIDGKDRFEVTLYVEQMGLQGDYPCGAR